MRQAGAGSKNAPAKNPVYSLPVAKDIRNESRLNQPGFGYNEN